MKKSLIIILLILVGLFGLNVWLGLRLAAVNKTNQALRAKAASQNTDQSSSDFLPSDQVKDIYTFAQENQGLLKKLDCYCGCQNPMHQPYHKSLANCFVKEITAEGQIIYDAHGQNCKTCIDEALDVKKRLGDAKNYKTIKNLIDSKYKPPIMNPSR